MKEAAMPDNSILELHAASTGCICAYDSTVRRYI